eukprot:1156823-Pelagomonas_calceolata.AAC.3
MPEFVLCMLLHSPARAAKGHASAPKKPTCPRQAADAVAGHALAPAAAVHLPHAVHAAYMPPSQPLPCPPSTPLPAVAPLLPSLHSLVEAWSLSWHLRYASAAALLQRGPPSLPPPTDVPPALSSRPPAASAAALPLPGPPSWPPPPAWHRSQLWLPPAACGTALPLPGLLPLQPPVAACPSHHPVAAPLLPALAVRRAQSGEQSQKGMQPPFAACSSFPLEQASIACSSHPLSAEQCCCVNIALCTCVHLRVRCVETPWSPFSPRNP